MDDIDAVKRMFRKDARCLTAATTFLLAGAAASCLVGASFILAYGYALSGVACLFFRCVILPSMRNTLVACLRDLRSP